MQVCACLCSGLPPRVKEGGGASQMNWATGSRWTALQAMLLGSCVHRSLRGPYICLQGTRLHSAVGCELYTELNLEAPVKVQGEL